VWVSSCSAGGSRSSGRRWTTRLGRWMSTSVPNCNGCESRTRNCAWTGIFEKAAAFLVSENQNRTPSKAAIRVISWVAFSGSMTRYASTVALRGSLLTCARTVRRFRGRLSPSSYVRSGLSGSARAGCGPRTSPICAPTKGGSTCARSGTAAHVGSSDGPRPVPDLVRRVFDQAAKVVFHADRGSQYTSAQIAYVAPALDVLRPMGRTGCAGTSPQRSRSGRPSKPILRPRPLGQKSEAKIVSDRWIEDCCNRRRRHSPIGMLTPVLFEMHHFRRPKPPDRVSTVRGEPQLCLDKT
jgi:hypothetical protein